MAHKAKKKSKLRHAEYYDMQKTFDSLYADSKSGEVFGHLMDIISAPNNIKLAFRNIKGNDGSHTAGTDGRTIESLAVMSEDNSVKQSSMSTLMGSDRVGALKMRFPMRMDSPKGTSFTM